MDVEGLYLHRELRDLEERFPTFRYTPCLDGENAPDGFTRGRANDRAFAEHPSLAGVRVYLCGVPGMVRASKKKAYLLGAALADIHADPFEPSAPAGRG